ncbi:MAG: ATP-NAD kinase family protein [Sedimentibacter sp.]|uniref:ATP-NAD kinase family protein n=1 Tax=Sedimentibacter sp. TaxID=1960295 RepID=UPI0029827158|nr:ATP-NAD kinase family protein [Sedimentibacter sp.]MDW5299784.1 ATP-NAD kinase family protein [Sedimentibacter sp.]
MITVGLIVNPIAGMGGSVGLKGTDGDMYQKAVELGSKPVASERINEVLSLVTRKDIHFIAAKGKMGEEYIKKFSFDYEVIGEIGEKTSSDDTIKILREMKAMNIDILIFVGGDGTARDVLSVVGMDIPVIGVPSGVKMFSSVFTLSAHAAAEMINCFGNHFVEMEVLDINEEAFRNNRLDAKLYGYVRVPDIKHLLQGKKAPSNVSSADIDKKEEVAEYVIENMEDEVVYILGPGTTLKTIADRLGVKKTILGVDAVFNKKLIGVDVSEKDILEILKKYNNVKIIVTPIGGNGFIFGRGSKQISSKVLDLVKKENIIIVSTIDKIGGFDCLRVDTGDYNVDKMLSGNINVIVGYNEEIVMEVKY